MKTSVFETWKKRIPWLLFLMISATFTSGIISSFEMCIRDRSCKGITIKERPGNPPPRVTEAPGGMLNAVGLQNPGVDHFIEYDLLDVYKRQGYMRPRHSPFVQSNTAKNPPPISLASTSRIREG